MRDLVLFLNWSRQPRINAKSRNRARISREPGKFSHRTHPTHSVHIYPLSLSLSSSGYTHAFHGTLEILSVCSSFPRGFPSLSLLLCSFHSKIDNKLPFNRYISSYIMLSFPRKSTPGAFVQQLVHYLFISPSGRRLECVAVGSTLGIKIGALIQQ